MYTIITALIFTTDTFIKKYIEDNKEYGKSEEILNGKIILNKYHNNGAALNFLKSNKRLLLALSGVSLGIIIGIYGTLRGKKGNHLKKLALSLLIGGASSNFFDRITKEYVVDYFSFNNKKIKNIVFNISDMAIFLGSFILILASVLKKDHND